MNSSERDEMSKQNKKSHSQTHTQTHFKNIQKITKSLKELFFYKKIKYFPSQNSEDSTQKNFYQVTKQNLIYFFLDC